MIGDCIAWLRDRLEHNDSNKYHYYQHYFYYDSLGNRRVSKRLSVSWDQVRKDCINALHCSTDGVDCAIDYIQAQWHDDVGYHY